MAASYFVLVAELLCCGLVYGYRTAPTGVAFHHRRITSALHFRVARGAYKHHDDGSNRAAEARLTVMHSRGQRRRRPKGFAGNHGGRVFTSSPPYRMRFQGLIAQELANIFTEGDIDCAAIKRNADVRRAVGLAIIDGVVLTESLRQATVKVIVPDKLAYARVVKFLVENHRAVRYRLGQSLVERRHIPHLFYKVADGSNAKDPMDDEDEEEDEDECETKGGDNLKQGRKKKLPNNSTSSNIPKETGADDDSDEYFGARRNIDVPKVFRKAYEKLELAERRLAEYDRARAEFKNKKTEERAKIEKFFDSYSPSLDGSAEKTKRRNVRLSSEEQRRVVPDIQTDYAMDSFAGGWVED